MTTLLRPTTDPGSGDHRTASATGVGPPPQAPTGSLGRLWRGPGTDPAWARPSAFGLLLATAVLYLWNLGASTSANSFYAAAVQAGTKSWKAFFFGSFDSSNYITVDKPPASLWVMELSGRIFGFSSWSMLAPQAIEGVLAVGLLYGAVRRVSGPAAALIAGGALALTPAAALMFRFNNPDAFLVLLLVAGAYCLVRALQSGSTRWMLLVGTCVGFGFITKMGQALLVVPAFALAYLIAGPPRLAKRLGQLLLSGAAMVVAAGWWVALVELVPAANRPYIGGSTDNNILNLAFGYNGLGRLFGGSGNGGGGGAGGGLGGAAIGGAAGGGAGGGTNSAFGGATGLTRLFTSEMALQISWLLPAALVALVGGLWLTRRAPRTDLVRASLLLWGGWLLVTGLVFSYMQGTIHPYYTVALAPAIAALVAITAASVHRRRHDRDAQAIGVAMILLTGWWTYHLLDQNPTWFPALRYAAMGAGLFAALVLMMARHWSRSALVAAVAAAAVLLSGSGAYAVATAGTAHTGSTPTVGPSASTGGSGGGLSGGFGGGSRGGSGGLGGGTAARGAGASSGTPPTGSSSAGGSFGGQGQTDSALTALLKASTATWAAAASSSMTAAPLELASGKAVMAIGGFNGSDNAITLTQFEKLVSEGKIAYFISGGAGGGAGGNAGAISAISTWVSQHYTAKTVGGTTVYDLSTAT